MFYSLPLYIGFRYAFGKRRSGFITFVSGFALLGMALGVFALIVVLSVMNGLDNETKMRILRVVPHGELSMREPMHDWQAVAATIAGLSPEQGAPLASAPYISGDVLLNYRGYMRPVALRGILPESERAVSEISESMLVGRFDSLRAGEYGIVLGALAARALGVTMGDKLSMTLPAISITPAGVFPRSKRFTVVGVFEVGAQVDERLALIHLEDAQKLYRRPATVEGLRLRYDDIYQAPAQIKSLLAHMGEDYLGRDWSQTQGSLFQALKMEKTVTGVMLSIIIAVAAFNIITSLIMMVAEKRSDIAVLRTLGATRTMILTVFIFQGLTIGVVGIALGCAAGIATAIWLPQIMLILEKVLGWQLFDPNVYFVSFLPSQWQPGDTLIVVLIAFALSFIATMYPAWRAALIEPADALRYDI